MDKYHFAPERGVTLHAHGLLRGGFAPPEGIRRLQDYQRLRTDHLTGAASQVQRMQQALERMNIKLHDVISDLTGVSGLKVVRAILQGERDPVQLLGLCDPQIQKRKSAAVRESLRGCWKEEHLFALRQALELWEYFHQKISECDRAIETLLQQLADQPPAQGGLGSGPVELARAKDAGKNAPVIARLQELVARLCGGRDVTQIPRLERVSGAATGQGSGHRHGPLGQREALCFVAGAGWRTQAEWQA